MKHLSVLFVFVPLIILAAMLAPTPMTQAAGPNGRLLTLRLVRAERCCKRGLAVWKTYTPLQKRAVQRFLHASRVNKKTVSKAYIRPADGALCKENDNIEQAFNSTGAYLWVWQQTARFCYDGTNLQYAVAFEFGTTYQMFWSYEGLINQQEWGDRVTYVGRFAQGKFALCFWGFCPEYGYPWSWQEAHGNGDLFGNSGY